MHALDYLVIGLFLIITVAAGMAFGGSGKDKKSFFAAGGKVPWGISGLSLFMSFFSAGTFVVWGSIAYKFGLVSVTIQMMMCLAGFLIALFIAPKWRKTGVLTAAEYIRERLGNRVQDFYTYLFLLIALANTGAFLYPVAKLVNVSTGIPIHWLIIGLGAMIILYTAVGGLWAVMVTDVLQFVVLTLAVVVVVPMAMQKTGGLDGFLAKLPEGFFAPTAGDFSWAFMAAFALYNLVFIGGNWAYVQRYTSVKDPKAARKVGFLFAGLYLICPLIWMLPPMIYRSLHPGLSGLESEGAYLLMCKEVLPYGMLGLILGGMIFATASSVNTTLNLAAAVFTNDIYGRLVPEATPKRTMQVARLSTLVFGIGTILVALAVPMVGGIVEVVLSIGAVTGCSLYGPPIWAMFSKRLTGKSVLAITLLSLTINVFFKFIPAFLPEMALNRANEMLLGTLTTLILLIINEVYTIYFSKENPDYVRYAQIREAAGTDDAPETSEEKKTNSYGIKVIGMAMAVTSLLVIALGAMATSGTAIMVVAGGVILLTSVGVLKFANK